jgi:hypothetical protein
MKFRVTARWGEGIKGLRGVPDARFGSPEEVVDLPDTIEAFLRAVEPYGRFSVTEPSEEGELWELFFENDYD